VHKHKFFTVLMILGLGIFLFSCTNEIEFKVYFDSNGGSEVSPITTHGKTTVSIPDNPTKEGFIFSGWYWDDTTFINPFTASSLLDTELANNMTVYAKWNEDYLYDPIRAFKVTFDSRGGSLLDPIYVQEDSTIIIPVATKDGYTLEGWYTSLNGGVTLDEKWSFTTSLVHNEISLYAKWEINLYDIEYYSIVGDQLGDIQFNSGETISSISLGKKHSSAVTSTGRLFIWGYNRYGQLGDGTTAIFNPIIKELTSRFNLAVDEAIVSVSLGEYFSSALTSTGRLFTWGLYSSGQLGIEILSFQNTPIEITSQFNLGVDETISSISLGKEHSSALTSTGRLFTWGYNRYGQLGDGATTNQNTPIEITSQFNLGFDETIISISLGDSHSSALTSMGRLFTWGYNTYGQIGDGTTTDKITPIEITSRFSLTVGETIVNVSLGGYHSSAVTSEGRIFTWGSNENGQIGDGTITDKTTPTEITGRFNLTVDETIVNVSLGEYHSSALTSEGRFFTWGSNDSGQIGDGTSTNRNNPTEITSRLSLTADETIINVSLGGYHSSLLTSEGRLFTWGFNFHGQLGDGKTINKTTPKEITSTIVSLVQRDTYEYSSSTSEYISVLEGFTFSGWHSEAHLTTPYVFSTMPASDVILYGKWELNEYQLLYNLDGGTNNTANPTLYTIETSMISLETPSKEGYTFLGWYDNDTFSGDPITNIPQGTMGDISLYAKWIVLNEDDPIDYTFSLMIDDTYEVTDYIGTNTELVIPSMYLGKAVTSIGENAFLSHSSITSVIIPSSVTSIGNSAFFNCEGLINILIGSNVTVIGDYAFQNCINLFTITIPLGVNSIGVGAFSECHQLVSIIFELGSQLTIFSNSLFYGCTNLMSIIIPANLRSIEPFVFIGCNNLSSITVDESNAYFSSEDDVLFDKFKTRIIAYPVAKSETSYQIPSSVTSIGNRAFWGCINLTDITIPSSVTSIEEFAFSYCEGLSVIILSSNVTSLGAGAFADCTNLASIVIPLNVSNIGSYAFSNCINLTIYIEAATQPSEWSPEWNNTDCPVVWGYVSV